MMETKVEDGGPAFPQLEVVSCERDDHGDLIEPFTSSVGGMTIRDHFAGIAMSSLMTRGSDPDLIAHMSYRMSDAMIRARKAGV